MALDKFMFSSKASSLGNKEGYLNIQDFIMDFEKINTLEEAKSFLLTKYKINDSIKHLNICGNNLLEISENKEKYSVRVSFKKNNVQEFVIFSFAK